jgi:hypothetical protein
MQHKSLIGDCLNVSFRRFDVSISRMQRTSVLRPLLLITGTELFASFTIDWTMGGTEAVVSLRSGLRSGASPSFSGFAQ